MTKDSKQICVVEQGLSDAISIIFFFDAATLLLLFLKTATTKYRNL